MADDRNRDRYAEIFEHAPIARLITDAFGVVQEANRNAADLLQVDRLYLIGKPLALFVPEDDRREFRNRLLDAADRTRPARWQMWLERRAGGAAFHAEIHLVASQTDIGFLHWAITDITDRIAMEQELRVLTAELEERVEERTLEVEAERGRLAAVIDQIPAGLTLLGVDGGVVMANAEARRLLGERLGDEIPEGRAELVRDEGTRVALEVSMAPIFDAEGQRVGALRVFQDVSAREDQERAERDFVTNAAHQLQSPLAGILSAVEVLQAGAKDAPDREVFLGHIEREANRLARLTKALLILARAQTGYEAPKDELVQLAPLLSEIGASLRPAADVAVEVKCPPTLAAVTNRELVEQALVNVAENAAKYTVKGTIALTARLDGDCAEVVVTDTGPGIPDGDQSHVLDRFYRVETTDSDGFGLGFAIVRSAVAALDGELELKSNGGAGTAVTIRLPRGASLVES